MDNWQDKFEPCFYSNRLLDKLALLNAKSKEPIDILEIKKAIYYAKKYHANQLRKTLEPYYSHPIEVAYMISDYLFKKDILITSLLYDTLEDTELTYEMIKSLFGQQIANQVQDLTRIKNGYKITSAVMVESLWIEKKYDLLLVKLFDRLHNMQTISAHSPDKRNKIVQETVNNFIVLAAYLNLTDIEKKIAQLCFECFNSGLLDDPTIPFGNDKNLLSLVFQNDLERK